MKQQAQVHLGRTVKCSRPEEMLQIFSQVFPACGISQQKKKGGTFEENLPCLSCPGQHSLRCLNSCHVGSFLKWFSCHGNCALEWSRNIHYPSRRSMSTSIYVFSRASLVAQWLRICLSMQGTRVRALVWEDLTCHGATRPVSHNYGACASGACAPQQEKDHDSERPAHRDEEWPPLAATRESPCTETKTQHSKNK